MAKKIKFPLTMKNDFQVRSIEELREHFDLNKAVEYFLDGKLLAWLEARYYYQESIAIRELRKDEAQLHQKICNILCVEYDGAETEDIDLEAVAEHNRKLSELKQYTSDAAILDKVDQVAFNQEDLADLLDEGIHDIYLCNNSFAIPLRITNRRYIGIGKAEAVIRSSERVNFDAKGIAFENVNFDSVYEKLHNETPEQLYQMGLDAENRKDYTTALDYYRRVADAGNPDGFFKLGWFYDNGCGVSQDYSTAHQWYKRAADMGNKAAMHNIGVLYFNGTGVNKNIVKGKEWYQRAVEHGNSFTMYCIGKNYYYGCTNWGYEKNPVLALEWLEKSADMGDVRAMKFIAYDYSRSNHVSDFGHDSYLALKWYRRAADLGDTDAMVEMTDVGDSTPDGNGVIYVLSEKERLSWIRKSIELNSGKGMAKLAHFYHYGICVEKNFDEAEKWYIKSLDYLDLNERAYRYCTISRFYEERGNIENAVKYLRKYRDADHSTFNQYHLNKLSWLESML